MDRKDMLFYFLSSAKNNAKRIKVTGGKTSLVKGYVRDLKREDQVIMVNVEGEIYEIDLTVYEVKTSLLDHRVIYVSGEENLKFQLC